MMFLSAVFSPFGSGDGQGRTLRSAVLLFVVTGVVFAVVPTFEAPFASPLHRVLSSLVGVLWWEYYVVAIVVGIAAFAFYRRSAAGALALGFAVGAGVGINLGGIGITGETPGVLFRLLWAAGLGVAFGVALGGVGFLLGTGLRVLAARIDEQFPNRKV